MFYPTKYEDVAIGDVITDDEGWNEPRRVVSIDRFMKYGLIFSFEDGSTPWIGLVGSSCLRKEES